MHCPHDWSLNLCCDTQHLGKWHDCHNNHFVSHTHEQSLAILVTLHCQHSYSSWQSDDKRPHHKGKLGGHTILLLFCLLLEKMVAAVNVTMLFTGKVALQTFSQFSLVLRGSDIRKATCQDACCFHRRPFHSIHLIKKKKKPTGVLGEFHGIFTLSKVFTSLSHWGVRVGFWCNKNLLILLLTYLDRGTGPAASHYPYSSWTILQLTRYCKQRHESNSPLLSCSV